MDGGEVAAESLGKEATMLDSIFQPFVDKSPVCVMAAAAVARLLSAQRLDRLFEEARVGQYAHQLLFSTTFYLMADVVSGTRKSIHHAYQTFGHPVGVSVVAVYDKLKGIETSTSQALVRDVGAELTTLIDQMGGAPPPRVPGCHTKILDGNCIAASEHRLKELRQIAAGALPGKSLVVLDADRRIICDVFPCEDGHTQERALLEQLIPTISQGDLWIDDRNFCTFAFLHALDERKAFFITRHHANMPCQPLEPLRNAGRVATGTVYQQRARVRNEQGQELHLRRIEIHLDQATRDGDKIVVLLTNLPATGRRAVDALRVAELYRTRWTIETAFQELAAHFNSEINALGYPKAALFGFCVALVLYNAVSLLRAALRAAHGTQKVEQEVSSYYIAADLEAISRGMMIAVPEEHWGVFGQMPLEEFGAVLLMLAGKVNLRHFKKHPRGPKKPVPKRTNDPAHPHVSTARILAQRQPRKRQSTRP
jgi:IS4 transposase